ncbi:hypothetical protein ACVWXU_005189 [Streptomyces sp. TE33382]
MPPALVGLGKSLYLRSQLVIAERCTSAITAIAALGTNCCFWSLVIIMLSRSHGRADRPCGESDAWMLERTDVWHQLRSAVLS